jgi:hypothetical protein
LLESHIQQVKVSVKPRPWGTTFAFLLTVLPELSCQKAVNSQPTMSLGSVLQVTDRVVVALLELLKVAVPPVPVHLPTQSPLVAAIEATVPGGATLEPAFAQSISTPTVTVNAAGVVLDATAGVLSLRRAVLAAVSLKKGKVAKQAMATVTSAIRSDIFIQFLLFLESVSDSQGDNSFNFLDFVLA